MLEVADVSYRIRGRDILRGVTVCVPRGRFVGIVGPNGAGKTTLLRIMAGVARPSSGHVRVAGRPLQELKDRERARLIGYMSQNPSIGFGFSVEDVVAMGRYAHRRPWAPLSPADREAVERAMAATDVAHLRGRLVTDLSGGERQRVFLARTLAQEPQVLLLDEPTSDLDVRFQLEILTLIRRLQAERGLTVVMAIHDLTWAARFCDDILALDGGQVVAFGPAESTLTEDLIARVFGVASRVVREAGMPVRVDFIGSAAPREGAAEPLEDRAALRLRPAR